MHLTLTPNITENENIYHFAFQWVTSMYMSKKYMIQFRLFTRWRGVQCIESYVNKVNGRYKMPKSSRVNFATSYDSFAKSFFAFAGASNGFFVKWLSLKDTSLLRVLCKSCKITSPSFLNWDPSGVLKEDLDTVETLPTIVTMLVMIGATSSHRDGVRKAAKSCWIVWTTWSVWRFKYAYQRLKVSSVPKSHIELWR